MPILPIILRSKVAGFVEFFVATREPDRLEGERRLGRGPRPAA
jgi:hypothetical protein